MVQECENALKEVKLMPVHRGKSSPENKICVRCKAKKPIAEFYKNAGWVAQEFHDAWCKECVREFCTNREKTKEYFFYNNRMWKDEYWGRAEKQASYKMATDPEYLAAKTDTKKQALMDKSAATFMLGMMALNTIYTYEENITDGVQERDVEFNPESIVGTQAAKEKAINDGGKIESPEWGGSFTEKEIKYLNDYYQDLEADFSLDTKTLRDYAMHIAKAALNATIAYDEYRKGIIPLKDYQGAMAVFDNLNKSATFAACSKRATIGSGMGSLGEIIVKLEGTGKLATRKIEFPPDDVDKIRAEFDHTYVAVGMVNEGGPQ